MVETTEREESSRRLFQAARDFAHGHGLVIRRVPGDVQRLIAAVSDRKRSARSPSPSPSPPFLLDRKDFDDAFDAVDDIEPIAAGWTRETLMNATKRVYFDWLRPLVDTNDGICGQGLAKAYVSAVVHGYGNATVAFSLAPNRKPGGFRWRPVALVSFTDASATETLVPAHEPRSPAASESESGFWSSKTAQRVKLVLGDGAAVVRPGRTRGRPQRPERPDPESDLNKALKNKKVATVDLVCSARGDSRVWHHVRGAGLALTAFVLSSIARARVDGAFAFEHVIMQGVWPVENRNEPSIHPLATRLGFRQVGCHFLHAAAAAPERRRAAADDEWATSSRRYYVLSSPARGHWAETVRDAIASEEEYGPSPCTKMHEDDLGCY